MRNYQIQLPNDAEAIGYQQEKPFHYQQIFVSKSCNFSGTEHEFLKAGHAYAYIQTDKHTRLTVNVNN